MDQLDSGHFFPSQIKRSVTLFGNKPAKRFLLPSSDCQPFLSELHAQQKRGTREGTQGKKKTRQSVDCKTEARRERRLVTKGGNGNWRVSE